MKTKTTKKLRQQFLALEKGTLIKGYRLDDPPGKNSPSKYAVPAGEGGSGVVFCAVQELYGDVIMRRAIKFFVYREDVAAVLKDRYGGPISTKNFMAEITNIAAFRHESVVKVVDGGIYEVQGNEIPYIVTEYIEGPTLRDVIRSNVSGNDPSVASEIKRQFSRDAVLLLKFFMKIGDALKHIHEKGFYHCDIAPKNIFIETDEGQIKPVIGDLGLAKDVTKPRRNLFLAGSKDYMPPRISDLWNTEVTWQEFAASQPEWDIYGFCKSAYEILNSLNMVSPPPWKAPLERALKGGIEYSKYRQINNLTERLEFLLPIHRELASVPELSPSIAGKFRKLMPVEALSLSKRVRSLIDHPGLLRLANVPQLTTAYQLFPGA